MHHLGDTRSAIARNHALHTPDTFVRAPLPGMSGATAIVHTAPAMGAGFTWYTAEFEQGGELGPASTQRFVYLLDGALSICAGRSHSLAPGGYAYLPVGRASIRAASASRAIVIEKPYRPHSILGHAQPKPRDKKR